MQQYKVAVRKIAKGISNVTKCPIIKYKLLEAKMMLE